MEEKKVNKIVDEIPAPRSECAICGSENVTWYAELRLCGVIKDQSNGDLWEKTDGRLAVALFCDQHKPDFDAALKSFSGAAPDEPIRTYFPGQR